MKFKSLMLGAAAAVAATGANAADLPVAPEPVDYVRICDAYGAGFYYIPGTETCLRVGGRVRADYRIHDFAGTQGPDTSAATPGVDGGMWDEKVDESTRFRARAYVNLDARTDTEYGLLRSRIDLWFTQDSSSFGGSALNIWNAFIQFGGFTFGRTGSFFDHWTGENWGSQIGQGLDNRANVLAYTASFGNGVSASLALEADNGRNLAVGTTAGGHTYPALVANVNVSQGWGSAQLSGVVRDVASGVPSIDSTIGWALAATARFDIAAFGSGGGIGVRGAYGQGASGWVDTRLTNDAVVVGTSLDAVTAWSLAAGATFGLTDAVSASFTGVYSDQDAAGANAVDGTLWSLHGQIAWSPVAGLVIGTEVEYSDLDARGTANDDQSLTATFRVEHTF